MFMWWVMFSLKKYPLLFYTEHRCIVYPKKCRWEEEEHQQVADGDVIQRVLDLLQSPPTSRGKDTSPGMTGWNRFKKKSLTCTEQLCESFSISWCFLVGPMGGTRQDSNCSGDNMKPCKNRHCCPYLNIKIIIHIGIFWDHQRIKFKSVVFRTLHTVIWGDFMFLNSNVHQMAPLPHLSFSCPLVFVAVPWPPSKNDPYSVTIFVCPFAWWWPISHMMVWTERH